MIYILTPCSRPDNLKTISCSIPHECVWIVLHEESVKLPDIHNMVPILCPKTGFVGADGRNYFLNNNTLQDNDWIYSLDDDNIIHPNFYTTIEKYLSEDVSIIHWGQYDKFNQIRLEPTIQLNAIDAACFISKWKYNKYLRYNTTAYNYDGLYAIGCLNNGPVLKLNEYLCFYNYLR